MVTSLMPVDQEARNCRFYLLHHGCLQNQPQLGHKYYQGKDLRIQSQLIGQKKTLEKLTSIIDDMDLEDRIIVSLVGIGCAG